MSKSKKKKVLITGANGFIGSHLCEALNKKGYDVAHLGKADIRDFKEILKIFKKQKPYGVFHLAALLPPGENNAFFDVNVKGTFNLLEACRLCDVKRFIYSSSMSVYGDAKYLPVDEKHPNNTSDFYGLSKLLGEELVKLYIKQYDLNAIILRYSGVYGPGKKQGAVANFIKNAKLDKPLTITHNISWDIIYIKDVVEANIMAFEKADKLRFEIINIGSGKEINIKDLAEKIIQITGSKSKIRILASHGSLAPRHFYFNINKAKRLLKFKPQSYDTSLKANIAKIELYSK